ncbi:unnamed protein product [Ilex paraguariensis]|uniref:SAM domain-containing protein n=1 Tax=Ilex paraguariensis TaxID=185542 RepID=A0ABC8TLI0_9AQUA
MAELQPPEVLPDTGPTTTTTTTTAATPIVPVSSEIDNTTSNIGTSLGPKRQRRPSVRLGEIGDPPATVSNDSHPRRPKTTWKFHKHPRLVTKTSKTRPLTNLVNGGDNNHDNLNTNEDNSTHNPELGSQMPKLKKPTKKIRTNLAAAALKLDNGGVVGDNSREDNDDGKAFREFEAEDSESPLKEQSPVQSIDNAEFDFWHRRPIRARVSKSRDGDHDENGMPESNSREERNCVTSNEGVRDWLIGLGLGRYAPVFEIHEVDDEVLPMLTLEDLKDMGINAVGSRRKMYIAILKLRKRFGFREDFCHS